VFKTFECFAYVVLVSLSALDTLIFDDPVDFSAVTNRSISLMGDAVAIGVPYGKVIGSLESFHTGQHFLPCTLTSVRATLKPRAFSLSNGSSIRTLLVLQYGNCTWSICWLLGGMVTPYGVMANICGGLLAYSGTWTMLFNRLKVFWPLCIIASFISKKSSPRMMSTDKFELTWKLCSYNSVPIVNLKYCRLFGYSESVVIRGWQPASSRVVFDDVLSINAGGFCACLHQRLSVYTAIYYDI